MPTALESLTNPFRRQLAELQARHASGALSQAQLDQQTAALERRLLDVLLHAPSGAPVHRPAASARLLAGLALGIVLIAGVGYWFKGGPAQQAQVAQTASEGEGAGQPSSDQIAAMVDQLAERLKQNPTDGEGWAMLARSYSVMERNDEALDAYARAVALRKDDASLLVDYADALGVKNQRSLSGAPMKLIAQALKVDPSNLKALALAGTEAFMRKDYAQAARYWSEVEKIGPAENPLVQQVVVSLQEARSRAGQPGASAPQPSAAPEAANKAPEAATKTPVAAAASVGGTVSLSPDLRAQVSPQDTVFIFARPASGGRMPLAAERVQVKDLPYRFTLDDSKSMSPSMPLSSSAQVVLGARISKSGDAIPQPGDLSGQVGPVALGSQGIALEINEVRKP
jgi:cytochrome c-type biogenesis protein CcmH